MPKYEKNCTVQSYEEDCKAGAKDLFTDFTAT
jgi:hypothetical protein